MKKYSLIIATLFLVALFLKLTSNYSERFTEIEELYKKEKTSSTSLNRAPTDEFEKNLSGILVTQNYMPTKEDADFVSKFLTAKLKEGQSLTCLSDLNKRVWQIPAAHIDTCGSKTFKEEKLVIARNNIGIDKELLDSLDKANPKSEVTIDSRKSGEISVSVTEEIEKKGFLGKLMGNGSKPAPDVYVRLSVQYIDSLSQSGRSTVAYLKTDAKGKAVFKGLDPELSYSVLPIKKDCEFGTSKGTIGGNLASYDDSRLSCSFIQKEHRLRIFDATTLRTIKESGVLTVRTPEEFTGTLTKYLLLFFAAWWSLWLLNHWGKTRIDTGIVAILMTLTGLCLLSMFSINDPLNDKLFGVDMAHGILAGVIIIALLQKVDFKKFYQNQLSISFDAPIGCIKWFFRPYRQKVQGLTRILAGDSHNILFKMLALSGIIVCLPFLLLDLVRLTSLHGAVCKKLDKLPKGSGYLIMALFLTALLFTPLGAEVGGMKVNLNIGILFQPSEIAKYLIIFFIASYFSVNANKIVQFSEKGNTSLFASKLKMMATTFIGLGILMGLYLVLGDMGPALVLAFTFIILYSIIKSKIDLEGLTANEQLKRIFTCDLAMLVYGVASFALFLMVGNSFKSMGIFCIAWFVVWILIGITQKQVFETPVFFNFIVAAFIFGGTILGYIPGLDSISDRLESRNEMCTNTWGTLPIDGNNNDAGENTQVAEGLWGLASGGLLGQGLGNGSPYYIPAFHTDMILESVGEQMGFVGIIVIVMLLAVLLRRLVVTGYRTSHPFTFYICSGIAVVTAIQFIIISLGSLGIIPLTGVTVPFFSYGKVSMILNLAAYGIILSIASHNVPGEAQANTEAAKLAKQEIRKYNYSVSLLSWTYCLIACFICGAFFYYNVIDRDDILIKPAYVTNANGIPVLEYNPRIGQLTKKMHSGNIYDRNGILLATSNVALVDTFMSKYTDIFGKDYKFDTQKRQSRYYPFGEHLTFMLGDLNSNLFTFRSTSTGYAAEIRHRPALLGYDKSKNDNNVPIPKVKVRIDSFRIDKWHSKTDSSTFNLELHNYSALVPYLKAGINSEKVKMINERKEGDITPQDIHLTIDAKLQAKLQLEMQERFKNNRLSRASVVIVDCNSGDLLASANYPLPSEERLKKEVTAENKIETYKDGNRPKDWYSYTDMDLGLMFHSAPGSAAKIMSSMAAFQKLKLKANKLIDIDKKELIADYERRRNYFGKDRDMGWAIKNSSNAYFVKLINENDLYDNLRNIYRHSGIRIGIPGDYSSIKIPYLIEYTDSSSIDEYYKSFNGNNPSKAVEIYKKQIDAKKPKMLRNNLAPIWQWAYGQGTVDASPLSMARVVSAVANDGNMQTTRFTKKDKSYVINLIGSDEAKMLRGFMQGEADKHDFGIKSEIGGKTGTPQREMGKGESYDGWYICYIRPDNANQKTLAIAARIERESSSTAATNLVKEVVLEILKDDLKYFE